MEFSKAQSLVNKLANILASEESSFFTEVFCVCPSELEHTIQPDGDLIVWTVTMSRLGYETLSSPPQSLNCKLTPHQDSFLQVLTIIKNMTADGINTKPRMTNKGVQGPLSQLMLGYKFRKTLSPGETQWFDRVASSFMETPLNIKESEFSYLLTFGINNHQLKQLFAGLPKEWRLEALYHNAQQGCTYYALATEHKMPRSVKPPEQGFIDCLPKFDAYCSSQLQLLGEILEMTKWVGNTFIADNPLREVMDKARVDDAESAICRMKHRQLCAAAYLTDETVNSIKNAFNLCSREL
jgi:hypothetical protein